MAVEIGQPLQQPETRRPAGRVASYYEELKENVRYRSLWEEISACLGDLGTFIPIVIALTLVNGLDLGTTLIWTGAYNIITGLLFGVPMPVQPMKSIAAAALTPGHLLTIPQIIRGQRTVFGSSNSRRYFSLFSVMLVRMVACTLLPI